MYGSLLTYLSTENPLFFIELNLKISSLYSKLAVVH